MFRLAVTLFVAGIASALVGLVSDDTVLPTIARVGFYVLVPLAIVVGVAGLLRRPKPALPDDDAHASH